MRAVDAHETPGIEPLQDRAQRFAVEIARRIEMEPDIFALGLDPVGQVEIDPHRLAAPLHPEIIAGAKIAAAFVAERLELEREIAEPGARIAALDRGARAFDR